MKTTISKSVIITILICIVLSSCKIYFPPLVYQQAKQNTAYDAVIVPGFPFHSDKPNFLMKTRVLWAKHLYDEGICKNLIFSGSAVYSPYYESKVMAAYAIELGIPEEHVFVENEAEHTTENLYFSYKIAEENGFKKVGFATDVYQTTFIAAYLKKLNMEHVDLLPMRYSKIDPLKQIEIAEIDYSSAYEPEFVSLLERQTLDERLMGTNGGYISETVE